MKKLILSAPNFSIYQAFKAAFEKYDNVEINRSSFQNIKEFDCMVSAANSFGLMDGGVDLAISDFFGWDLQGRVQKAIIEEFRGEQPVGTSIIVETNHPKHPYVAHTPTMRVPIAITRTDYIYKAMFAMLLAVEKYNKLNEKKIDIVVCPGLGTGTGRVAPKEAARQMKLAYRNFHNPPQTIDWDYASKRQEGIIYGGDLFY